MQEQGSFPIKRLVAILFVMLWNLLFLSDKILFFLKTKKIDTSFGLGTQLALGMFLLTATVVLISKEFRTVILKEGRKLNDIKKFLYLIILITGIFL